MLEEPSVACPYCGESITILVDTTAGAQQYVEDCFVCCQPILLSIEIGIDGGIDSLHAEAENG